MHIASGDRDLPSPPNGVPLEHALQNWLAELRLSNRSQTTIDWYRDLFLGRILPGLQRQGCRPWTRSAASMYGTCVSNSCARGGGHAIGSASQCVMSTCRSPWPRCMPITGCCGRSIAGPSPRASPRTAGSAPSSRLGSRHASPASSRHLKWRPCFKPPSPGTGSSLNYFCRPGFRASELCALDVADFRVDHPDGPYLDVRSGKGARQRASPLTARLTIRLRQYLAHDRPRIGSSALFVTERSRQGEERRPLSRNAVELLIRRLGRRAGIKGSRLSPHTFGTRLPRERCPPAWTRSAYSGYSVTPA